MRVTHRGPAVQVGDHLVSRRLEVQIPSSGERPSVDMVIEIIDGVPRCTELTFRQAPGGREIRPVDLQSAKLDSAIEYAVAIAAIDIDEKFENGFVGSRSDDTSTRAYRAVRDLRRGSRRPMTEQRLQRIADTYHAQQVGGLEAIEIAFGVSRATAARYLKAAREAGLVEERK